MSLLTRLGVSEEVMGEVHSAVESHSKPRIVPAAEKTVHVLRGKMDRAEKTCSTSNPLLNRNSKHMKKR